VLLEHTACRRPLNRYLSAEKCKILTICSNGMCDQAIGCCPLPSNGLKLELARIRPEEELMIDGHAHGVRSR